MSEANDISHNNETESSEVMISIEQILRQLPPVHRECSIYRVPKQLFEMNHKAYTPQLISIGPFHYFTRQDLIANEQYKLQGFINFLRRINIKMECSLEKDILKIKSLDGLLQTSSLKFLVEKADSWVKVARNCYATPIKMNDQKFLIMMLVDACFIVDFFIQAYHYVDPDDPELRKIEDNVNLFSLYPEIILDIFYDLIKLENQVPFFLLQNLFDLILKEPDPMSFITLTNNALCFGVIDKYEISLPDPFEQPKNFVDFLSIYFLPLPSDMQSNENREEKNNYFFSFFGVLLCHLWNKKRHEKYSEVGNKITPPSITELSEAGVTIKKAENVKCLINISFNNGVLEIPQIHIDDSVEVMFRNMVAFEHFVSANKNKHVIQYVMFLDDLISTENDVHLLVNAGVIINNIGGDDKEVADLFNNFGKYVTNSKFSDFNQISKALREHCSRRWNKAKASLKHNYFNTPWAAISFFAATFLLILTVLQTIFTAITTFPTN